MATNVSEEYIASIFRVEEKKFQRDHASKQVARSLFCLPPAYLLVLLKFFFFYPEDGGDMFLRNVGCISTDYTASHPRR
jgi:hypothetical protein